MIDLAKGYFRRTLFKTYRFLKHPRKLKRRPAMRWFALHFLDKSVWKPSRHTLAGGVAVGLFVSVQLLPIQMPTAVLLAALFRVNIPIALVMCWLSNPLTVPALIPLEYQMGKWVLAWVSEVPRTPFPTHLPDTIAGMWLAMKEHAPVMLFGGVVLGGILTPLSYACTYLLWNSLERWTRHRKHRAAVALEPTHNDA